MNQFIETWIFDPTVGKIISTVLVILITMVILRFARRLTQKYIKESSSQYRIRKFTNFLGYFLGILVIIFIYSDRLGGITVALGVAGAGIAFALQELIASVAGWFTISFSRFYKTGDRVQLGGIKGDVIDIGILRTTIMEVGEWVNGDQYNGRVARIANSFVFKEPVFNYSGDFPFLWDEIKVPIRFGSDHASFRKILQDIAQEVVGEYSKVASESWEKLIKKYLIEHAQVNPMITIVFDENWITFTLRYVVDYKKRRSIKDTLFERILEEVSNSEGRFSVASAAFEVTMIGQKNS